MFPKFRAVIRYHDAEILTPYNMIAKCEIVGNWDKFDSMRTELMCPVIEIKKN